MAPSPHVVVAGILGTAGLAHFAAPRFFDRAVPHWMPGSPRTTTVVSGVVELTAAALVAVPRTRRVGGWLALATFAGVYPANIQAVVDGGLEGAPPPLDTRAAAVARLPLQFPMFWWAWRVIREAEPRGRRRA